MEDIRPVCKLRFELLEKDVTSLQKEMIDFESVKEDVHEIKQVATAIKHYVIGALAVLVLQQFGLLEVIKGLLF